jgi:hypothetical protein
MCLVGAYGEQTPDEKKNIWNFLFCCVGYGLPPVAMSLHSVRDLDETCDVGTRQERRRNVFIGRGFGSVLSAGFVANLQEEIHQHF